MYEEGEPFGIQVSKIVDLVEFSGSAFLGRCSTPVDIGIELSSVEESGSRLAQKLPGLAVRERAALDVLEASFDSVDRL